MSELLMRGVFSASFRRLLSLVVAAGVWGGFPAQLLEHRALAGGGPENVLLVVNRNSPRSLRIANHYVRLRRIPAGNVLTLPLDPAPEIVGIDQFRNQILLPTLSAIKKRRLSRQIDYIVYSSDFPWGIELNSDIAKFHAALQEAASDGSQNKRPWPQPFTRRGSINGLTYLWQPVLAGNMAYFHPRVNRYMRLTEPDRKNMALSIRDVNSTTLGFKSRYQFGPRGELVPSGGIGYLLSMMLGVTTGRGNSVDEVLAYLSRSALADGTHPRGTIYFVRNHERRSVPRHGVFPAAVEELKKLGVAAEIVEGKLPIRKHDVQGAMIGWHKFKWESSGSTILPGAICEHFTSYGGNLRKSSYQTPLSEFLRYGAAAASGTVTEPYASPVKFPSAMVHVHYARGCTLAEAFYQSVSSPYQLLIVGDPLCRPWANIPQVDVVGLQPGAVVKGTLTLQPSARFPRRSKVDHFELFIDGWLRTGCGRGESLSWDTTRLADGYHELRVVAIEAGLIGSQGRAITGITTANHGRQIAVTVAPKPIVRPGQPLWVAANSPRSTEIAVLHNSRLLGKIPGEKGRLRIDPAILGYGPVRLRVVGLGDAGPQSYVWAEPIEVTLKKN